MLTDSKFLRRRIEEIVSACTFCGKCFEICPTVPYTSAKGANSEEVTKDVVNILKDILVKIPKSG